MKKRIVILCVICALLAGLTFGCAPSEEESAPLTAEQKGASEITAQRNQAVYDQLDFDDQRELEFAQRGLICAPESLELKDESGKVIWSQAAYSFLEDADAPDTVNPSLWRNTQLNHIYGLFEVTDGIYQVRGYDMSNITFVKGDTGWIVFDPLMSVECAQAAKALVDEQLGEYPIMGVIISHSHVDHFGGIRGIISEEEVAERNVPIIAPEGFEEHAISENVYAGTAMGRRAAYQYGTLLDADEQGAMCIGIGMGQSTGTVSYISPTDIISQTGEVRVIDGVTFEFQMTPGTEAPAEMNTWLPEKNALWLAENCTGTLHNLYTLRGAQVRDGNAWANYIMEALARYGEEAQVVFQSHNWPHWGNDVIGEYMENTAAVYKFIHDQTLFYINQGYTETEIADMIQLPADLEQVWYTRQYYGTLKHNVKAVYQKYMGWYDANPIHLDELAPTEYAQKLVEYLGDTDKVLEMARADFEAGEYRVLTLPARHGNKEEALLYCVQKKDKTFLWLNDSGPLYDEIYPFLAEKGIVADLVSFDCTFADEKEPSSERHMNIFQNMQARDKMTEYRLVKADTKYYVTHFSHNSAPFREEMERMAERYGFIAAHDGSVAEI